MKVNKIRGLGRLKHISGNRKIGDISFAFFFGIMI